jgi:hypothetical protein
MDFYLERTSHTPLIKFEDGKLIIAGRSIPEDITDTYDPLFEALAQYSKNPQRHTEVSIMLDYSNSSTNRVLMSLFDYLNMYLFQNNYSVTINWYYVKEDNEMLDLGNDFKDLVKLPFALIAVDDFPE